MNDNQPSLFEKAKITLESDWFAVCASKDNWELWLKIAREQAPEYAEYWGDVSGCERCKHLDGNWCNMMDYPASVNPLLKKYSMPGMACCGMGNTEKE